VAPIDKDIEHVRAAMLQSLNGIHVNAILTPSYWRRRLNEMMRLHHLSRAQLERVDGLLRILDQIDTGRSVEVA
jgi:hypothetical protein